MNGLFFGLTTIDLIYPIDSYPSEDSKTNVSELHTFLGGPATTAAITFAALGGNSTLISPVGNGPWSSFIKERLSDQGINHIDLAEGQHFSPTISSILSNQRSGLRTIFTAKAPVVDFNASPQIDVGTFDIYCLDGFTAASALPLLQAKPPNIPVVFDGGSYKDLTEELLRYVHYPIFSERFQGPGGTSLQDFAKANCLTTYAITHGPGPITLIWEGARSAIAVRSAKAIDTLGAGDIFHGAFSWYILKNLGNVPLALAQSSEIAALSCEHLGPRAWIEHLSKLSEQ